MARKIKLIVYPVSDLNKAKDYYGNFLGEESYADSPYYVGYRVDGQEIGLDPNSKFGPIGYVEVEDIKTSLQELVDVGGEIVQDVKDVGGGKLIAQVKDADGNVVGFTQEP
jgi:predicted enzyme related to lactoylglutathione lyase